MGGVWEGRGLGGLVSFSLAVGPSTVSSNVDN